jgi:hypothetical protein
MIGTVRLGLSAGFVVFACTAFSQEVAFDKKVLCDEAYYASRQNSVGFVCMSMSGVP